MIMPFPAANAQQSPPGGDEPVHGVCPCQVDAVPRLALCGTDCSDGPWDEPDAFWSSPCVVCLDLYAHRAPCRRCGWAPR